MNDTFAKRTEIRIQRSFASPPARVFRAWTEPEDMARWMWASLGKEVWAEVDLRVGGAYRIYTRFAGGRHQGEGWSGMCGLYAEIVPDRKLVYTLQWDADVGYNQDGRQALDEVVKVTLEPDGDGTLVEFVQHGIPDDGQSAPAHEVGTAEALDLLAALLA